MNEFSAKKLGEVLAFNVTGLMLFERGENALTSVLGEEYAKTVAMFSKSAERIHQISEQEDIDAVVLPKSEKTKSKLISMAELYIGDEWDNPAELMEWFGFFEGAAIIHWQLVVGVAETTNNKELSDLANEAVVAHTQLLTLFSNKIKAYASKKSEQ